MAYLESYNPSVVKQRSELRVPESYGGLAMDSPRGCGKSHVLCCLAVFLSILGLEKFLPDSEQMWRQARSMEMGEASHPMNSRMCFHWIFQFHSCLPTRLAHVTLLKLWAIWSSPRTSHRSTVQISQHMMRREFYIFPSSFWMDIKRASMYTRGSTSYRLFLFSILHSIDWLVLFP